MAGNVMGSVGPAHTGNFRRALYQDRQRLLNHMAIGRELGNIKAMINRGELDYIPWLDQIIARINTRQFPDQGFARVAREVVDAAHSRRMHLLTKYKDLMGKAAPEIRERVYSEYPNIGTP